MASDPEEEMSADRTVNGLPVLEAQYKEMHALAVRLGVSRGFDLGFRLLFPA